MNKTLVHRSLTVFYRTEDERPAGTPSLPPLMLLHGFLEDGSIWEKQIDYLKKSHRLIIPDLPGSGKSSPLINRPGLTDAAEPSIDHLADFIKAILDAEAIGQCTMIGHSMGGYITLAFAEKYPDRLAALGLFHSTAYPDSEAKKNTRRKSIEFIRRNGPPEFIRQSIPNLFAESYKQANPEIVAGLIERYIGFHPDSLIYYYQAMIARPDRTEVLKRFPGPVLFIAGDQDNAIPLIDSLQQSHLPALSYLLVLEDCGHQGMLEKTGPCNRMLKEFLQAAR